MSEVEYSPGLAGVIAGETTIGVVTNGKLLYRGYTIEELAEKVSFEEAAALPVAYGTAHRMLITHNTIRKGDRVLVLSRAPARVIAEHRVEIAAGERLAALLRAERLLHRATRGAEDAHGGIRHLPRVLLQRLGQLHRRGARQVAMRRQLRRLERGFQGTRRTDFLDR